MALTRDEPESWHPRLSSALPEEVRAQAEGSLTGSQPLEDLMTLLDPMFN